MGKASSAKKVARAARAGGSTKQRKRNWAFPVGIAMIFVIGALVVFFARQDNQTAAAVAPKANVDHWHAAFGIYVCDAFLPAVADGPTDTLGIHTHGDGIIHIHPFQGGSAGKNAKMQIFGDQVGMSFSGTSFTMPDGTSYDNGYDCKGTPAVVTLSQWNNVDELKADPQAPPDVVYTKDFGSVHFENDRMAFTLAVAPEGTTIPPPESIATVDQLDPTTDSPTTSLDLSGLTGSSTTVAGEPSSTVAGASSTTVASTADSTSTTVAGATTSTATTSP